MPRVKSSHGAKIKLFYVERYMDIFTKVRGMTGKWKSNLVYAGDLFAGRRESTVQQGVLAVGVSRVRETPRGGSAPFTKIFLSDSDPLMVNRQFAEG